MHPHALFLNS